MKKITPEKVAQALEQGAPLTLESELIEKAQTALKRMHEIAR